MTERPAELEPTPANQALFDHLEDLPPRPDGKPRDPYWEMGSHPDCVEWVWDKLGAALPAEARRLLKGRAALCHPPSGRVLAMPYGTAYILWLAEWARAEAADAGYLATMEWSGRMRTDLSTALGDDGWVFGKWNQGRETAWLRWSYSELG